MSLLCSRVPGASPTEFQVSPFQGATFGIPCPMARLGVACVVCVVDVFAQRLVGWQVARRMKWAERAVEGSAIDAIVR